LNNNPSVEYSIVSIDIEHFKMFNEWYGFKEGDNFLIDIAAKLNEIDKSINSISGYFGDDNFCIVLPNKEQNYRLLEFKLSDYIKKHGNGVSFLPHFGVYVIKDKTLNISQMYDRAMLANDNSKGNFSTRFSFYNDDMLGKLKTEQIIQQEVKKGMMNNEFTFFLQPQYNIESDKIIACEALVRWISNDNGAIPAYKFIPV
jgi:predicted signal transduction protein with EAL and GGDEF domain